jgi:mannan endo-1,4-beta-mannosidase
VDYIKEKDVHNILYVYGPGSEANNAEEYAQRYPGDAYVDMIGYDLYHSSPTKDNEAKYLADISKQNSILKEFATKHQKLYAITETGVANGKTALLPSGNEVKDWYMQLLNQISEEGVCYFLTWANFSDTTFYLPFVTKKNADGTLHGHETLDDFINFDNRSIFATDMNGGHKQINGVTNTNKGDSISGYFTTPLSGDRILKKEQGTGTKIAVKLTGVKNDASNVKFVFSSDFGKETITASYVEKTALWEAMLEDSVLEKLGESIDFGVRIYYLCSRISVPVQSQQSLILLKQSRTIWRQMILKAMEAARSCLTVRGQPIKTQAVRLLFF